MSPQSKIAFSFKQKEELYRRHAKAQEFAANHLAHQLALHTTHFDGVWIDLGSGASPIRHALAAQNIHCTPYEVDLIPSGDVIADMDELPFKESSLNGVLSSSALQWSTNLPKLLTSLAESLKPNGTLALSFFVEGSLAQLVQLQKEFDIHSGVTFHPEETILNTLHSLPLEMLHCDTQEWKEYFPTTQEALKSLSMIGATPSLGTPLTPRQLRDFMEAYQDLHTVKSITHRYQTFTAILKKRV